MDTRYTKKRALIIRAAAQAFGRKGFHPTTLDQIASDLGVTKPSLYYYFSTKEELLFEVHKLLLEDILWRVEQILARETSPVARLQAIVIEHLDVFANDYEGAFLLQQEYELPQQYRADIVVLRDAYEQRILAVVNDGVRQRLFRVKDARVTVRIILGALNWFLRWYRATGRLTVSEIADAYVDFILYGILAPPTSPPVRIDGALDAVPRKRKAKRPAPGRRATR